jgi:hypothetical protein
LNVVVLPLPATLEEEAGIVRKRVGEMGAALDLPAIAAPDKEIERVVTMFRELRGGQTLDGKTKVKTPSGSLSTAEAIAVTIGAWAEAGYFGSGAIDAHTLSVNLLARSSRTRSRTRWRCASISRPWRANARIGATSTPR